MATSGRCTSCARFCGLLKLLQANDFDKQQADHILIAIEQHAAIRQEQLALMRLRNYSMAKSVNKEATKIELQQELSALKKELKEHTESLAWKTGVGATFGFVATFRGINLIGDQLSSMGAANGQQLPKLGR